MGRQALIWAIESFGSAVGHGMHGWVKFLARPEIAWTADSKPLQEFTGPSWSLSFPPSLRAEFDPLVSTLRLTGDLEGRAVDTFLLIRPWHGDLVGRFANCIEYSLLPFTGGKVWRLALPGGRAMAINEGDYLLFLFEDQHSNAWELEASLSDRELTIDEALEIFSTFRLESSIPQALDKP